MIDSSPKGVRMWREHRTLFMWALHSLVGTHRDLDRRINERAALYARIAECAYEGKIWVCETGRDCDCVQYTRRPYQIDATPKAYFTEYGRIAEWADGPFHLHVMEFVQAQAVVPASRDLAAEAFEDGHPHSIHA